MHNVLDRLYRTKLLLSSLVLVVAGGLLLALNRHLETIVTTGWLRSMPFGELGGILVGGGLLSVWLDHFLQDEQQALDDMRLRQLLHDQAPAMRDAVLEAFAANHDDLKRVATPETLDAIITNSLALRLKDQQFAEEVYADIRDQAVMAQERWYDAALSIELAPLTPAAPVATGARSLTEHVSVTVRWEYTTIPHHAQRRFACLSDRAEYIELTAERGDTSAWYLNPRNDFDASLPEAYELLRFAVDGEERPIRRAVRKKGQLYSASVGREAVDAGKPVTIAYTFRTLTRRDGNLLFFDIEVPTRDLRVEFDYGGCGLDNVRVLDLVPSLRPTRIEHSPAATGSKTVRVDIDGWIFPRSGVAFVWGSDASLTSPSAR